MGNSQHSLGPSYHTSLRNGTNKLAIETGRWKRIPRDSRICSQCEDKQVEDELHFLLKCSKYNNLRTQLFVTILKISNGKWDMADRDSPDVFILLLNGTGDDYEMEKFQCFHKYLQDCFNLREN